MSELVRVAAVQLQPRLGDPPANLAACAALVAQAAEAGSRLVVLPEFFTTGMAYRPSIGAGAVALDRLVSWLREQATAHDVTLGGSFLCRDRDGDVRNAFLLADPKGILGRHDKDLPTMWENAFYVGGDDDGVIELRDGRRVGVALCWELMRSQTVRRLRGRVDLVLAGSAWWSVPPWRPHAVTRRWEASNARTAAQSIRAFAQLVGAPGRARLAVRAADMPGAGAAAVLRRPLRGTDRRLPRQRRAIGRAPRRKRPRRRRRRRRARPAATRNADRPLLASRARTAADAGLELAANARAP